MGRGVKQQWGGEKRPVSVLSVAISLEPLENANIII